MPLDDSKRIDILLKEYDTLRADAMSRMNSRFLMMGTFGALIGFSIFSPSSPFRGGSGNLVLEQVVCLLAGLVMLVVWIWMGYLAGICVRRVSQIELKINEIAGEELMVFESKHGFGRWGVWLLVPMIERLPWIPCHAKAIKNKEKIDSIAARESISLGRELSETSFKSE